MIFANNSTYANIFGVFSPLRDFTPVGSNLTQGLFFVPGSNPNPIAPGANPANPAQVKGFGAVFTDIDLPDDTKIDCRLRQPRGGSGV